MTWRRAGLANTLPPVLGLALYLRVLDFGAMVDDFQHLEHIQTTEYREGFLGLTSWVRPIEMGINYLNYALLGPDSFVLSHSISLISFALCIVLVGILARCLLPSVPGLPFFASMLFLSHPANVQSVYQIDTLSQQLATLFALLLFLHLLRMGGSLWDLALSSGLFCSALLSKETSLGFLFFAPVATAVVRSDARVRKCLFLSLVAFLALVVTYFGLRFLIKGSIVPIGVGSTDRYLLTLTAPGIARNAALLLGLVAYLGSTLDVFPTVTVGPLVVSALISTIAGWLVLTTTLRLIRHRADCPLGVVALFALLVGSLAPAILANRVSELYAYGLTPIFSILLAAVVLGPIRSGIAPVGLWRFRFDRRRLASAFLVVCCVWMGFESAQKLATARRQDDKTKHYRAELRKAVESRQDRSIAARADFNAGEGYSVLIQPDDRIFEYVSHYENTVGRTKHVLEIRPNSLDERYFVKIEPRLQ